MFFNNFVSGIVIVVFTLTFVDNCIISLKFKDMFSNCFKAERKVEDHEEVELLLEGYRSDLQEMQIELILMKGQIDDTREFTNTHQVISKCSSL